MDPTPVATALLTPETGGVLIELVGAVVLVAGAIWARPWLRKRSETAATEAQRSVYSMLAAAFDLVAGPAVAATEQLVASKLRAAEPNPGKLDAAQSKTALAHAMGRAIDHFGSEQLKLMAAKLGISANDLERVLETHLEAALQKLKLEQAVARKVVAFGGPPMVEMTAEQAIGIRQALDAGLGAAP